MTKMSMYAAQEALYWANSYQRPRALSHAMINERDHGARLALFLEHWSTCDAPWGWRSCFAKELRYTLLHVSLAECLSDEAREWFDALPAQINIYRGCQLGRERGLSWTTDIDVALGFAQGKRCTNSLPTLMMATIPKQHVFGVFIERNESEVVVDPRRLRQLRKHPSYTPQLVRAQAA
jgi:hypothetical protein